MTQPLRQERKPNLPGAVRALRAAVNRLIEPTGGYANNTYIEAPGLYIQLTDTVAGLQGSGNGGIARSLPPVWVDAADQLNNIDLMVGVWPTGAAGNTVIQLRALAAKTWPVEHTRRVRRLAGIINAWADDIYALLNHQHIKYISAPCPACGIETVERRDSGGDLIRSPALQLITELGCTCQSCHYAWSPEYYLDLIDQLGFDRPAGVLE